MHSNHIAFFEDSEEKALEEDPERPIFHPLSFSTDSAMSENYSPLRRLSSMQDITAEATAWEQQLLRLITERKRKTSSFIQNQEMDAPTAEVRRLVKLLDQKVIDLKQDRENRRTFMHQIELIRSAEWIDGNALRQLHQTKETIITLNRDITTHKMANSQLEQCKLDTYAIESLEQQIDDIANKRHVGHKKAKKYRQDRLELEQKVLDLVRQRNKASHKERAYTKYVSDADEVLQSYSLYKEQLHEVVIQAAEEMNESEFGGLHMSQMTLEWEECWVRFCEHWSHWRPTDVACWLQIKFGDKICEDVTYQVLEQEMDGQCLPDLSSTDLLDVGLRNMRLRQRILQAVHQLPNFGRNFRRSASLSCWS